MTLSFCNNDAKLRYFYYIAWFLCATAYEIPNKVTKSLSLLKQHQLRITRCRKDILSLFQDHEFALDQAFIEKHLPQQYDRITIYRTLRIFEEKGVVHKVPDDFGTFRYALCSVQCKDTHQHDHVHFKCRICGHTRCLENNEIPRLILPAGYLVEDIGLLVTGICPECTN